MDAPLPVPPGLPGVSASRAVMAVTLFIGFVGLAFVVGFAPFLWDDASRAVALGGHLPWPALQWAVSTPVGTLVLTACCLMVIGPSWVLSAVRQLRREPIRALDVTTTPPLAWPAARYLPPRPQGSASQRWLGHGRRDQTLNLALLILGILLAVTLVGVFVASCVLKFNAMGSLQCDAQGNHCAPTFFSLTWIVFGSWFIGVALFWVVRARWLRRIEASSRVWLRYRTWLPDTTLYYLRQPGVTPEAASAALARFSSMPIVPSARGFFLGVLAIMPYAVLTSASFALSAWLQLHWVPG